MLIISRYRGERVLIGDNVIVEINNVEGGRVSLAIDAPKDVLIIREELQDGGDHKRDRDYYRADRDTSSKPWGQS